MDLTNGALAEMAAPGTADPDESDALVARGEAHLLEMRGREMRGWLRVGAVDADTEKKLARWVELGTTYARSLPAKP